MDKLSSPYDSNDPPLGIICRCKEYREIANKFVAHTVGTLERQTCANFNAEAFPDPVKVRWLQKLAEMQANLAKPAKNPEDSNDSDSDTSENEKSK